MRKYKYSLGEMASRLLKIARSIKKYLFISTLASIFGNLSHMGLMGFGAMAIIKSAGLLPGSAVPYIVLSGICGAMIALCRYLEGVYSHIGAYGLLASMRVHLFDTLEKISPAFMIDRNQGDVLNIAVSDIETLEFFFAHTIGPMFTVILLPVTTIAVAARYSPLFAVVLVPVYVLISIVIPLLALKTGRSIGMNYRTSLGRLNALILESVYSIRDIQIFGIGKKRKDAVMAQNEKVNHAAHRMTLHSQAVSSVPNFFVYLARILIISIGAYLSAHGESNPAGTIVVSFVAAASFSSTFSLTFVVTHLLETFAAAERLFIIEDTVPQVQESAAPQSFEPSGDLVFSHVDFIYPKTEKKILDELNLTIRHGSKVGIVGESGAGKSTILRLLLRFYDPTEGQIFLGGTDTRDISLHELHQAVAMLEQDTYLFDDTIANNIALARPDASAEEIKKAAERAGIASFIETLPEGYQTPMGQMGSRLSGGERQRVGIARIMLADPQIVVMDEPTSALDVLHEKELLHTLKKEYADKTIMIISHRLSTLTDCDTILRLEGEKLIEAS